LNKEPVNEEVERMFNIQCSMFKLKGKREVLVLCGFAPWRLCVKQLKGKTDVLKNEPKLTIHDSQKAHSMSTNGVISKPHFK